MIIVLARLPLKAGVYDQFLQRVNEVATPTRGEPGCSSYRVYTEVGDDTQALFVEEWNSRKDLDQHFQTKHFSDFGAALEGGLLDGDPEVMVHDVKSSERL